LQNIANFGYYIIIAYYFKYHGDLNFNYPVQLLQNILDRNILILVRLIK